MRQSANTRVRLLTSPYQELSPGICGTIISESPEQTLIKWDNERYSLVKNSDIDSIEFGTIIEGCSFLTMDDVLRIAWKKYENLIEIKDSKEIQNIIREFCEFTRPLRSKRCFSDVSGG